MTANEPVLQPVFALSIHADYRCRHAGACCTSGWPIPVETAAHGSILVALESRRLVMTPPAVGALHTAQRLFEVPPDLPPEYSAVLGADATGRCMFFEADAGRLCTLHRQLGPHAPPTSCRLFPRDVVIDRRGVFVTLSHYCPTAARMLCRDDRELTITTNAPAFPPDGEYEGLDARDALPPMIRPDLLFSWEGYDAWERFVVSVMARDDLSPARALDVVSSAAERLRAWQPADGSLDQCVRSALDARRTDIAPRVSDICDAAVLADYRAVVACIPPTLARPAAPVECERLDAERVAPAWPRVHRIVRRYLAAKAFASWVAYQGRGVRSIVRSLTASLAVLRVEAARAASAAERDLDEALLVDALRASDLVLVHMASRDALAALFSVAE